MSNPNKEISCHTCRGACCQKNAMMQLTTDEANFMTQGGTNLFAILEASPTCDWAKVYKDETDKDEIGRLLINAAKRLKRGQGYYLLLSDCGYLQKDSDWWKCSAYIDTRRPGICAAFEPGSPACLKFRVVRGVDSDGSKPDFQGP